MKTFKVYFRHNNQGDFAFVEATNSYQARFKILARFYDSVINKVVEL